MTEVGSVHNKHPCYEVGSATKFNMQQTDKGWQTISFAGIWRIMSDLYIIETGKYRIQHIQKKLLKNSHNKFIFKLSIKNDVPAVFTSYVAARCVSRVKWCVCLSSKSFTTASLQSLFKLKEVPSSPHPPSPGCAMSCVTGIGSCIWNIF